MVTKKPAKTTKPDVKKDEVETTGHEWDGIKEYNNPLPRWWLWTFFACIVYSIGYVIYYPAIPLINGFTKGISGWSQYKELDEAKDKANLEKGDFEERIKSSTAEEILADDSLYNYTVAAGQAQFALDCSQCHGLGANGAKGYPSLIDDEWIWGGDIESIITTITHGIRSVDDEDTHDMGPMMAFGADEILSKDEIKDVVSHLLVLSGKYQSGESSSRGETVFAENCASCHGEQGEGSTDMGAPTLANQIWLYGGTRDELFETIYNGRAGIMPAFGGKHDASTVKKLAIYVHSLSQ
tara:strand:- start:280533 stop:281420 length:888 start_codon:yes stop_codon:yes gene_type:complete